MALQNAEKRHFRSEQNGHCDQQVTDVPGNFAHVFANKVPALLAPKSRGPQRLSKVPFSKLNMAALRGAFSSRPARRVDVNETSSSPSGPAYWSFYASAV